MEHWEQKLAIYVYNHCNICNISIYFCNIHMKAGARGRGRGPSREQGHAARRASVRRGRGRHMWGRFREGDAGGVCPDGWTAYQEHYPYQFGGKPCQARRKNLFSHTQRRRAKACYPSKYMFSSKSSLDKARQTLGVIGLLE